MVQDSHILKKLKEILLMKWILIRGWESTEKDNKITEPTQMEKEADHVKDHLMELAKEMIIQQELELDQLK